MPKRRLGSAQKIGRERRPESSPGSRERDRKKVCSDAGLFAASDEHLETEAGGEELELAGAQTEQSQQGSRFQWTVKTWQWDILLSSF